LTLTRLRQALPGKFIGYTFPEEAEASPFREVVTYGHQYLDTITVFRANQNNVAVLEARGVPKNKIVWGLNIGCSETFGYVALDTASFIAQKVLEDGYAGVTTWSVNRDTNHRWSHPEGNCDDFQTGLPDGSYIEAISAKLT